MAMISWIHQQGPTPYTNTPGPFDARKYNAVEGGYDGAGTKVYVGRGKIEDVEGLHVGKIITSENTCFIPFEGDEHRLGNFEILSAPPGVNVQWVPGSDGQVPPNAVEGGYYEDGSKTYIGRFQLNGFLTPGEIVPNEGVCYISLMGKEEESNQYEVLVMGPAAAQPMPLPLGQTGAPPTITGAPPTITWINQNGPFDPVAIQAFEGGCERNGTKLYVGRSLHEGGCHIGKVRSDLGICFVPYEGEEHEFNQCQVLCTPNGVNVQWVSASNGNVPPHAVEGGYNDDRSKTYVGRVHHDGVFFPGEVAPKDGLLYIADDGEEKDFEHYDVLVIGPPTGVYGAPSAPPF